MKSIVVTKVFNHTPKTGGKSYRLEPGMHTDHIPASVRQAAVDAKCAKYTEADPAKSPPAKL